MAIQIWYADGNCSASTLQIYDQHNKDKKYDIQLEKWNVYIRYHFIAIGYLFSKKKHINVNILFLTKLMLIIKTL